MIYSVKFQDATAFIHAENLKYAISTAKRLGRHVFHTVECYVSLVKHPLEIHHLQADQAAALLGDPIPVRPLAEDDNVSVNLWAQLTDELNQAGL